MDASSVEKILGALNGAGVRYLIAGGLAVVAHGHVRFTKDLDLIIALDEDNVRRGIGALSELGFAPVVAAVRIEDFADAGKRHEWVRDKGATVFTLFSDQHRMTPIDIFIDAPLPFERAYADALEQEYAPNLSVRFVGRGDLLSMKRLAGRPQDLLDIEVLERLSQS
jgi:hypothetical protein